MSKIDQTEYRIGQVLPPSQARGIVHGPEIAPVWHALIVAPQKEIAVREYLRAQGIYAFFPSQDRVRRIKGREHRREYPIVSGYIYAQFRQAPQWDVMKEYRRLITGVFCMGGEPVSIHRDVIRHLQGLTVEAERLREARAEMVRVRPGDRAKITAGPLAGFFVEVEDVKGGEAWFQFITGGKGRANIGTLERIIP